MAGWVAAKRLYMGGGAWREPGEAVPEAETWTNTRALERNGELHRVSDREFDAALTALEAKRAAEAEAVRRAAEDAERARLEALAKAAEPVVEAAPPEPAPEPDAQPSPQLAPEPVASEVAPEPVEPGPNLRADLRGGSEPVPAEPRRRRRG
jgi:hypothetical protein